MCLPSFLKGFIVYRQSEYPGQFIVVEGIDGSGKTTFVEGLVKALRQRGETVVQVKEPGTTDLGNAIRQVFFEHHDNAELESEIGLLLISKIEMLRKVVYPSLALGHTVICDRYTYSLLAYQHHFKGHSRERVLELLESFDCLFVPDRVFYLDVSPEVSLQRTRQRENGGGESNSLDQVTLDQRACLRAGFDFELRHLFEQVATPPFVHIRNTDTTTLEQLVNQALAVLDYKNDE